MGLPLLLNIAPKLLVILSVSFLHHCQSWRRHLHPLLCSAAPPGTACALFWPPAGMELRMAEHAPNSSSGAAVASSDSLRSVQHDQHGRDPPQALWWRRCAPCTACSETTPSGRT